VEEKVYVALMFLANGGDFKSVARQACNGVTTVQRYFHAVCASIVERMADKIPGPPETNDELYKIVAAFEQKGRMNSGRVGNTPGIPNIFACIGKRDTQAASY
jgi:hypothetical protein